MSTESEDPIPIKDELVSISSTFHMRFLHPKLHSWNVSRESCTKHFCTRNALLKCWWNRPQVASKIEDKKAENEIEEESAKQNEQQNADDEKVPETEKMSVPEKSDSTELNNSDSPTSAGTATAVVATGSDPTKSTPTETVVVKTGNESPKSKEAATSSWCQFYQHFTHNFSYESVLRSFYVLAVSLCSFLGKRKLLQNLLVKCYCNQHKGLISPMFYEQLLRIQIQKVQ
jgi:hypothetical protein